MFGDSSHVPTGLEYHLVLESGSGSHFPALPRVQSITLACLHPIQHGHVYFSITDPMSFLNQRAKQGQQNRDLDFWQTISPKESLADLAAVREFL